MNQKQWLLKSKIGPLYLVASSEGLQGVFWKKQPVTMAKSLDRPSGEVQILAEASQQIEEYLAGKRFEFDLPINANGTSFQKQVWNELLRIPYGKTFSYQEIAKKINHKKAARAVGAANGKNPLSIIVPCHRVIASDGSLGGYAGGLKIKSKLLGLETKVHKISASQIPEDPSVLDLSKSPEALLQDEPLLRDRRNESNLY
jgi:methylated-DNA-[protein]-cysteine S-methyltransferase